MTPTLVPAILAKTSAELALQFDQVRNLSSLLSYDVADGQFVPSLTPSPRDFPQTSKAEIFWHLMVEKPLEFIDECLALPTKIIAVQAEAGGAPAAIEKLASSPVLTGLVVNPSTPVRALEQFLPQVDLIQIMTVIPGAQGQHFLPAMLPKLSQLRCLKSDLMLAVDGGVSSATIESVLRYRPDYIVVGSALTRARDPAEEWRVLSRLVAAS
ncbi:hypothetical protein HYW32_00805 [Candidatus Berkelbacteria bacterium]|nr:hypothetical protein [Candidatus Berkelbacteria bacterium]